MPSAGEHRQRSDPPRVSRSPSDPGESKLAPRLIPRGVASRCGYCLEVLAPARRATCRCGAAYHSDCWTELDRCATLGCECRPSPADRARAGACPACRLDLRGTFRWERGACGGCGAVYHLGCRATRARCATAGCACGRDDLWGGAFSAPHSPGLTTSLVTLAARAFRAATPAGREPSPAAARARDREARRAALRALARDALRTRG